MCIKRHVERDYSSLIYRLLLFLVFFKVAAISTTTNATNLKPWEGTGASFMASKNLELI